MLLQSNIHTRPDRKQTWRLSIAQPVIMCTFVQPRQHFRPNILYHHPIHPIVEYDSSAICRYETGDHVGVYAHNNASIVNALGMLLNTNLDTVFALKAVEGVIVIIKHPQS